MTSVKNSQEMQNHLQNKYLPKIGIKTIQNLEPILINNSKEKILQFTN